MRYNYFLAAGAVFAMACEALFGSLSTPNIEYCDPGDGKCSAGTVCDVALHRCVPEGNGDGGLVPDGGVPPTGSNREFFGAEPRLLPLYNTMAPYDQAVLYRGDFDGNGVPDIFAMGATRYVKLMNPASGGTVVGPTAYKASGNPEMVATGFLDGDNKADIAIVLDGTPPNLEVLLSADGSDTVTMLSKIPRAVAIGDFNGDSLNDLAIGYLDGSIDIKYASSGGNPTIKNFQIASVTVPSSLLTTLVVPPYKNANNTQDLLVGIRSGNTTSTANSVHILRGNVNMAPANDSIDLSGIPDEIVVGQFASAGQYDAAVLVGGSGLDVISNLTATTPTRSSLTFSALRAESSPPNKGRLAVGRLLSEAQPRAVDDLAVLMQDGLLAVYPGGTQWANQPPLIAGRGLAAEKILAGAFYTGSTNDAIAAYSDGAQGATIAISRYFGTGAGALPNLGQQYLSTTAGGPNEMIFSGAFSAVGAREFVLVGGGGNGSALRCAATSASAYSCSDPLVLSGSAIAGTTLSCSDRRSRVLVARATDFKLQLLDFSPTTGTGSQLPYKPSGQTLQLEVADLNGDGSPDVVARLLGGKIERSFSIAGCVANGGFLDITPANVNATRIALVDVNGDGPIDLVIGENGKLGVYPNSGNGTFSAPSTYTITGNLAGVAVGDFRGTGQREMVIMTSPEPSGNSRLTWLSTQLTANPLTENYRFDLPMRYEHIVSADTSPN